MKKILHSTGVNTTTNLPCQAHSEILQAADELRRRIAERIGGNLGCSARYVREDREH